MKHEFLHVVAKFLLEELQKFQPKAGLAVGLAVEPTESKFRPGLKFAGLKHQQYK